MHGIAVYALSHVFWLLAWPPRSVSWSDGGQTHHVSFFARRRPDVDDFRAYVILQRMDSLDLKKIARACPARPKLFAGWRALKICSSVEGSIQNFSAWAASTCWRENFSFGAFIFDICRLLASTPSINASSASRPQFESIPDPCRTDSAEGKGAPSSVVFWPRRNQRQYRRLTKFVIGAKKVG